MNKVFYKKWLFQLKNLGGNSDPLKERPRPYRDWHNLMIVWFLLLIITSGIHWWLFQQIKTDLATNPNASESLPVSKLDPARLHAVVEAWNKF